MPAGCEEIFGPVLSIQRVATLDEALAIENRNPYGNAASIFAGDWLLVEALRRVERSGVPGTLERLLGVIEEMILAESLQLDQRGSIHADRALYLSVVEGKTASLFRWALFAGARAGGLSTEDGAALEEYGLQLGTAFQVVDDVLDFEGVAQKVGKKLFADLREGKMTLPLIFAVERQPALVKTLEAVLALPPGEEVPAPLSRAVLAALQTTRSVEDAREFARARVVRALASLKALAGSPVVEVLTTVAQASLSRES